MASLNIKTNILSLYGIFIGDCYGSPYEGEMVTGAEIGCYTDDTEQAFGLTLWLKSGDHSKENLEQSLRDVYSGPIRGYALNQTAFLEGEKHRTDSYGNGSSMRVAPVGEHCDNYKQVIQLSVLQSKLTHDHPDSIDGAVTIAFLAFFTKTSHDPYKIKDIYPNALFPVSGAKYDYSLKATESVPPAVEAFLDGQSFEDVLKRSLSYGGDTDTIAAMACGLAALKFGVPKKLLKKVVEAHPDNILMADMIGNL